MSYSLTIYLYLTQCSSNNTQIIVRVDNPLYSLVVVDDILSMNKTVHREGRRKCAFCVNIILETQRSV